MFLPRKALFALAALALLSGCAVWDVQDFRAMKPQGSAFNQALAAEYTAYVKHEIEDEYEWYHAARFARQGQKAAQGQTPAPLGQETFPSPASQTASMNAARDRLLRALDSGGRDRLPAIAARAQVMYECWLEEVWEEEKDDACMKAFEKAMAELEAKPAQVSAPAPVIVAQPRNFLVFFDFNKALVTPDAQKIIEQAAAEFKKAGKSRLDLVGHADRSGSDRYNLALSLRRAEAVKAALVKQGVAAGAITMSGKGESQPLVPTADGAREPQNRRVEIILP
jgi:OOP family OmpA-OmpF porin